MVGFGTKDVDLNRKRTSFCSALGIDSKSWGFSYRSVFLHGGVALKLDCGFNKGSIVGIHLDSWHGCFTLYVNGKSMHFGKLKHSNCDEYYPLLSSTAAKSGFRLIYAKSSEITLQILACYAMRDSLQTNRALFDFTSLPPGLQIFLKNNMPWLKYRSHGTLEGVDSASFLDDSSYQRCSYCHPIDSPDKASNHIFRSSDLYPGLAGSSASTSDTNQQPCSSTDNPPASSTVSSQSATELSLGHNSDSSRLPQLKPMYARTRKNLESISDWYSIDESFKLVNHSLFIKLHFSTSPSHSSEKSSSTEVEMLWDQYGDPESTAMVRNSSRGKSID
ncbi:SPRY domain-containing SOCS box protein 3 [Cichlidogyrus casuarinus]|uniref:SPRY domain-containing SOCS box protein 3 n=1 Tax=Cichlidogyrus casuarinus TaxID=1844966 RepID=A0ABD2QJB8_9PLAT